MLKKKTSKKVKTLKVAKDSRPGKVDRQGAGGEAADPNAMVNMEEIVLSLEELQSLCDLQESSDVRIPVDEGADVESAGATDARGLKTPVLDEPKQPSKRVAQNHQPVEEEKKVALNHCR